MLRISRVRHLGLRTNLSLVFLNVLIALSCVISVSKDEVSDLIEENNKQLMDSFKVLLTETVGQIKRANEYLAEQQMKEIKKLKYNEPRKFKKKANENQV